MADNVCSGGERLAQGGGGGFGAQGRAETTHRTIASVLQPLGEGRQCHIREGALDFSPGRCQTQEREQET